MSPPPNEVYTVFSFIGFVLCAIPLYWHYEASNAGTCLYMIWTGLGCLMQCINSIVWNKNMINRVPVYCDISTHIQVALNVAVPASSLCINRQLYKAARMKTAGMADDEKRRNLIYDLLIGVGIPVLQMISEYVVSSNRYDIFEDIGPLPSSSRTPLAIVLFFAWPAAIGTISLFYCVMAIYAFYKRRQTHMRLMSSPNRGRYLRLMAISFIEILGTIPMGTYYIAAVVKEGVIPWKGWARMHSHYSEVVQVAGFIWRNDPKMSFNAELGRWSLVLCAFIFFALFGFAGEAREHYRRLYQSLARRIGKSTSTLRGAPLATPSGPYAKRNGGVANPTVVQIGRSKDSLSISLTDQSSTLSISMESTLNQDSMTLQDYDSDIVSFYTAKSFDEPGIEHQCQLAPPPGLLLTVRPVSVPSLAVLPPVFLPTVRPASVPSTPPPGTLLTVRPVSVPSLAVLPPVFLPTVRPASVPSTPPPGTLPTLHTVSVLAHIPDPTKSTMPVHASSGIETV